MEVIISVLFFKEALLIRPKFLNEMECGQSGIRIMGRVAKEFFIFLFKYFSLLEP